jgi:hypothetical protein
MLCGATAARAGDAACLWRNLPKPVRTGIIAAYKERGGDGLDSANITNDLVRRLVRSCSGRVASDDQARGAGAALAGEALAAAAAAELSSSYGLGQARLASAWSRLQPGARSVLRRQFEGAEPTAQGNAQLYGVIRNAAVSLGWNEADSKQPLRDPEFRAIADYFTGRAQADAFAAAF